MDAAIFSLFPDMYAAYMEPDIVYIMSESVLPVPHILPQKDPFPGGSQPWDGV